MVKRMNKSKQPEQISLDPEDAFVFVAFRISNGLLQGQDFRNRLAILRRASGVIWNLLRTIQYPRDGEFLKELVWLNRKVTQSLDNIILNAEADDPRLQVLQELAKDEPTWPTLVRPGDARFTATKLERLGVGSGMPIGALPSNAKRAPSLGTASNRVTPRVRERVENLAEFISASNDSDAITHLRFSLSVLGYSLSNEDLIAVLRILRSVKPLTEKTVSQWTKQLTEFVLLTDPDLERDPELKTAKSGQGAKYAKGKAKYRSRLQGLFGRGLKNLLK
jgi:hypothetical protein